MTESVDNQLEFDYDVEDVPDEERNEGEPIDETADEYAHVDEDPPGVPAPEDLEDQNPGYVIPEEVQPTDAPAEQSEEQQ